MKAILGNIENILLDIYLDIKLTLNIINKK